MYYGIKQHNSHNCAVNSVSYHTSQLEIKPIPSQESIIHTSLMHIMHKRGKKWKGKIPGVMEAPPKVNDALSPFVLPLTD